MKSIVALVVAGFLVIGGLVVVFNITGHNDDKNYQIYQSVGGKITVIDKPGYYPTFFPSVWTYPRAMETKWSEPTKDGAEDHSITCKFNDSGKANVSTYVKIQLPTSEDKRRLLFRETNGNPENVLNIVRAHLTNCINVTGPMMSATEHQSARSAEFSQLVYDQLQEGLYQTRVVLQDTFDTINMEEITNPDGSKSQKERKVKVQVNEIVVDKEGKPRVLEHSPLDRYGIEVVQFSVIGTNYDEDTDKQFAARKQSILAGEQAKAMKAQQIQERLMVEERGKRELAEVTAEMNKAKERATIEADQKAEVAKIAKDEAVTKAMQKAEVAEQERFEAIKRKEIADIVAQTAELTKKATISQAEAQQKAIELGGGISEKERVLAEINANRDVNVAAALSKVNVPGVVIVGGSTGDGKSASLSDTLMNLVLLDKAGVTKSRYEPVSTKQ